MVKSLLFGALFIALAIASGYFQMRSHFDLNALARQGIDHTATATGATAKSKRGSTYYSINISYSVAGTTYTGTRTVPEAVFNQYASKYFFYPSSIPIRYLPGDPDVFEIKDADLPEDFNKPSWLGVMMMLCWGLIGAFFVYSSGFHSKVLRYSKESKAAARRIGCRIIGGSKIKNSSNLDPAKTLEELKRLCDLEVITREEYEQKKSQILSRL
jgi:hypothetical protein